MQRLQRISVRDLAAREPLPDLLGLGKSFGAFFRRGQSTMIAAYPNNGKSAVALWLSVMYARLGYKVLYFSADTDEWTTWKRSAAIVTGQPQSSIEQMVKAGTADMVVSAALARLKGRLSFSFETDPTYTHLQEEVAAFFELWGEYPDVVVVDNLMDVVGENEDEYGGMRDHTKAFKRLARATDSCLITLHHCNEPAPQRGRDGQVRKVDHPPARAEITGKVAQKGELIITARINGAIFQLAVVKNRDGDKDEAGELFIQLRADFDRMQFFSMQNEKLGAAA